MAEQDAIAPAAADDETIYIKDKKIGLMEYSQLAAFFGEDDVDRGLWNDVLAAVSQSEDTGVRRMVLAIVLEGPAVHDKLRAEDEIYYRAKKLIHRVKCDTGRASGFDADAVGLGLYLRHFVVSKEFIIFLLVICIIIASVAYVYYRHPQPGFTALDMMRSHTFR